MKNKKNYSEEFLYQEKTITIDELIAYLQGIRMSHGNLPVLSLSMHPDGSVDYWTINDEPNFAVANPDAKKIGGVNDIIHKCPENELPKNKKYLIIA